MQQIFVSLVEYYEHAGPGSFHMLKHATGSTVLQIESACRLFEQSLHAHMYHVPTTPPQEAYTTGVAMGRPPRSIVLAVAHRTLFRDSARAMCKLTPLYDWSVAYTAFDEYTVMYALTLLCGVNPRTVLRDMYERSMLQHEQYSHHANVPILLDYAAFNFDDRRRNSFNLLQHLVSARIISGPAKQAIKDASDAWATHPSDKLVPGLALVSERADTKLLDYLLNDVAPKITSPTQLRVYSSVFDEIVVQLLGTLHMLAFECKMQFTHHDVHRDNLMVSRRSASNALLHYYYQIGSDAFVHSNPLIPTASRDHPAEVPTLKLIDFGMATFHFVDRNQKLFHSNTAHRNYDVFNKLVRNVDEMKRFSPSHDIVRTGLALMDLAAQLHMQLGGESSASTPQLNFIQHILLWGAQMLPANIQIGQSTAFLSTQVRNAFEQLYNTLARRDWTACLNMLKHNDTANLLRAGVVDLLAIKPSQQKSARDVLDARKRLLTLASVPRRIGGTAADTNQASVLQFAQVQTIIQA